MRKASEIGYINWCRDCRAAVAGGVDEEKDHRTLQVAASLVRSPRSIVIKGFARFENLRDACFH